MKWPPSAWRSPTYFISFSRGDDGNILEVFVSSNRPSTGAADLIRDASIIVSIALQYGTSVDELRSKVSRLSSGDPASIIGAVLDMIAGSGGPELTPPSDPILPVLPAMEAAE